MIKRSVTGKTICYIGIIIIILDQLTKYLVRHFLTKDLTISGFGFQFVKNTGAGFGILQNQPMLLVWISLIILGLLLYYNQSFMKTKLLAISYALLIGGLIGNLLDRIIFQYVTDFIKLGPWPNFNIADMALTAAIIGFIIYSFKESSTSPSANQKLKRAK
jgi:signal peptidase II